MAANPNDISRTIIISGLKQIPEVGDLLSSLCATLWPVKGEDIWSEIKAQVEQLINQKISDLVYQQVSEDLVGLNNNVEEYLWALKNSQVPTYISEKWNFLHGEFLQQLPHFQSSGYEMLLLPLFAQFANLHLSLLRDGALFGKNWGWSDTEINHSKTLLTNQIKKYSDYVNTTWNTFYNQLISTTGSNKHKTEPFNTLNRYKRQITLTVLDYKESWPYFDITVWGENPEIKLTREIYSDPFGTSDDSLFVLSTIPESLPKEITVWGWDRIDAIQLDYPEGKGPFGQSSTGRMGDAKGGSNQPPHGGQFNIEKNPIVKVEVCSGSIINSLKLHFSDGTNSGLLGGNWTKDPGTNHIVECSGHKLSSMKVMGWSHFYGSADCLVLGFKLD